MSRNVSIFVRGLSSDTINNFFAIIVFCEQIQEINRAKIVYKDVTNHNAALAWSGSLEDAHQISQMLELNHWEAGSSRGNLS